MYIMYYTHIDAVEKRKTSGRQSRRARVYSLYTLQ